MAGKNTAVFGIYLIRRGRREAALTRSRQPDFETRTFRLSFQKMREQRILLTRKIRKLLKVRRQEPDLERFWAVDSVGWLESARSLFRAWVRSSRLAQLWLLWLAPESAVP